MIRFREKTPEYSELIHHMSLKKAISRIQ